MVDPAGLGRPVNSNFRETMLDMIYIGMTLLFFGLSWAFVRMSERLQ